MDDTTWTAKEWFDHPEVEIRLGVHKDSTDKALDRIIARESRIAAERGEDVDGIRGFVYSLRESLIASEAAKALGKKGGKSRSPRKIEAARKNGNLGGRPPQKTFRIYSNQGSDFGTWRGETAAHALSKVHRAAGYAVKWDRRTDSVVFPDDETRELCGDIGDWSITQPTR